MAPSGFFVSLVLLASAVHHVVGQQQDFLSIDCGLDDPLGGYPDEDTGIFYVPDSPYVDTGENLKVSSEYQSIWKRKYHTVRSFQSGVRNCYHLPTVAGAKYMVRLVARYGNQDGRNDSSAIQFDVHLGANFWVTVHAVDVVMYEMLLIAWASWAPVCLVNTGNGVPFLSLLELRKVAAGFYPPLTASKAMYLQTRRNMGGGDVWYPDDQYDHYWWREVGPQWRNLQTTEHIQPDPSFNEPQPVLQTAVESVSNNTTITYQWQGRQLTSYIVFLHFADFQNSSQARQFDIYFNGIRSTEKPYSPPYLAASCLYNNDDWFRDTNTANITLAATATSVLPPMLNALELFSLISLDNPKTFPKDFDAIMTIKHEYGLKKNWMGDPCFPSNDTWDGVKCSTTASDNTSRIISLDLSNSSLNGSISNNFTLLMALENLLPNAQYFRDLSYNNLDGSIPDSLTSLSSLRVLNVSGNNISPDFLCKNYIQSIIIRYESDVQKCTIEPSASKRLAAIIAISVLVPVLVVVVLITYCIWRQKRKSNGRKVATYTADPQVVNAPGRRKHPPSHLQNTENRRFTYKELEKYTNKFEKSIGQGGFGPVYLGRLEDNTEVAVKMRAESSAHGLDQFLAEVESLTKVHHRNIVSLIGYCWEKDHLALVYEYMSRGNLLDHLRGRNSIAQTTLNWGTRVRVVLEAAEGLSYLHKGCSPKIIHRDVKSSNILLGQNLQAKIGDFGLCKTYLTDAQSHMSLVTAVGTAGYIDPQYYLTGRLTDSSDVFGFGVVLLEVATGEPPIVREHGHIVQRVQQMIAAGGISSVADARLGGAYDINSMSKLVDTAMLCTAESSAQRPTMAAVVAQLKESLALEEARLENTCTSDYVGESEDTIY